MTKLGLFVFAAAGLVVSVVACGSSDATGSGSSSGSSSSGGTTGGTASSSSSSGGTSTGPASAWALALCAHQEKCDAGSTIVDFGSQAACAAAYDAAIAGSKAAPDTGATDANLNACATAVQAADCSTDVDALDACNFKGTRAIGAGCAVDEQCSTGLCQFDDEDQNCGKCANFVTTAGASCATTPCGAGLLCDDNQTCQPVPTAGQSCSTLPCAPSLRCIANTCAAALAKDATCTAPGPDDDDPCGGGQVCVSGKCTDVKVTANAGEACGNGVECINGDCGEDNKCAANLAAGAACDDTADDGPFCGGLMDCISGKCAYDSNATTCN